MAYYSGQATSYQELLDVLVTACVDQGWTWADGILSKGGAFVRPYISTSLTSGRGPGIIIQGGTGKSGANLLNPSVCQPRLGAMHMGSIAPEPTFPVNYKVYIFNNPDEVYLVINFGVDRYYYLAFGISDIQLTGSGLWLTATTKIGFSPTPSSSNVGFVLNQTTGGSVQSSHFVGSGPFWQTGRISNQIHNYDTIHTGIDTGWSGSGAQTAIDTICGLYAAQPLISIQPNIWNTESLLLPIQITRILASSKVHILANIRNARYLRIDNFEAEQIILLGDEEWQVLPFHRKNRSEKNGGTFIDHTGTFGWAIRYDGP